MYEYRLFEVMRVVDGDTVDARLDLGFGIGAAVRIRIANIDTPEVRGPAAEVERGRAASAFTSAWFAAREPRDVVVRTFKASAAPVAIGDAAYGRWRGEFADRRSGEVLADALRAAGHEK